jgi:predicted DNA binding protein
MIVIEFGLTHSILLDALERAPRMRITWERSNATDENRVRFTVWAEGGDFEAFERGLQEDPTVTAALPAVDVNVDDRRLYRFELTDVGLETSVYPALVEGGGLIRTLTATHEGWEFRVEFPDRDSFDHFVRFCRQTGLEMDVHRLYKERRSADAHRYGLSEPQRRILAAAIRCGYLEIPRESSLSELADRLDVSETAASERFRRAVEALIEHTVYPSAEVRNANGGTE